MASEATAFFFYGCHRASAFLIQRMSWRKKLTSLKSISHLLWRNQVWLTAVWMCKKWTAFSFPPTGSLLHFFILVWTIQSNRCRYLLWCDSFLKWCKLGNQLWSIFHPQSEPWPIRKHSSSFILHQWLCLPSSSPPCLVTKQPISNLPF